MPVPFISQVIVASSGLQPPDELQPPQPSGLVATDIKTSDFTAGYNQYILINPGDDSVTVELPTAVGHLGNQIVLKNDSDTTDSITVGSTESIDGSSSATIHDARGALWLVSDNSIWTVASSMGVTIGVILEG
jgi:hypothetical protein